MEKDNKNTIRQIKNLYRITTFRLGDFYVVASSFDAAKEALESRLDKADYGFFDYRRITNIECVATETWSYADESKQNFHENMIDLVVANEG